MPNCSFEQTAFACVTMTWEHAVRSPTSMHPGSLTQVVRVLSPCLFPPGQVLAVSQDRFLIADAFGGRIALLDLDSDQMEKNENSQSITSEVICVDDSGEHRPSHASTTQWCRGNKPR